MTLSGCTFFCEKKFEFWDTHFEEFSVEFISIALYKFMVFTWVRLIGLTLGWVDKIYLGLICGIALSQQIPFFFTDEEKLEEPEKTQLF